MENKKRGKKGAITLLLTAVTVAAIFLCSCGMSGRASLRITHYAGSMEYLQSQRDYEVRKGDYIDEGGFTVTDINWGNIALESDVAMYDSTLSSSARSTTHKLSKGEKITLNNVSETASEIFIIEYLQ